MEVMEESAGPGWDASPSGAYIFTSGKTVVTITAIYQCNPKIVRGIVCFRWLVRFLQNA
jgi:hypothetical protein